MSLELKNLTKSFDGKVLFDGLSYTFDNNGIYALVGRSGVGKTTLLRMIAGLDRDYSGSIVLDDGARVSLAFQEHRLFPQLTALENIVFAISDRKDEAVVNKSKKMLIKAGLCESDLTILPEALSGGMKQRVSLVRALMFPSEILLLDEPTKELDKENARLVRELILEAARTRLVIISSHSTEDIEALCPKLINL